MNFSQQIRVVFFFASWGDGPRISRVTARGHEPRVTNHYSPITNHAISSGKSSLRLRDFRRGRVREIFEAAG
jgi:hypothetical protein